MNKMGLKVFGNTGEAKLKVFTDNLSLEKVEGTKRSQNDRQYNDQKKRTKRKTMIYKTIH